MKRLFPYLLSAALALACPAMAQESDTVRAYGVLNLSVANMRAEPDFSSEMITQGLLGMPVRVLGEQTWQYVQTPDRYKGWVHPVAVHRMTRGELEAWNRAEKVVVTAHYGFVLAEPHADALPVSDVVAGDRLKWEGRKGHYYRVSYPDGRTGYLHKSLAKPEHEWRHSLKQDAASILRTAHTLTGVPYLWAGTSSKGVDCSGFVRTVLFMHDIIIPRDASQQAGVGRRIDIAPDFSNLEPGDLVFFGRKATGLLRTQGHGGPQGAGRARGLVPGGQAFHPFAGRRPRQQLRPCGPVVRRVQSEPPAVRHALLAVCQSNAPAGNDGDQ